MQCAQSATQEACDQQTGPQQFLGSTHTIQQPGHTSIRWFRAAASVPPPGRQVLNKRALPVGPPAKFTAIYQPSTCTTLHTSFTFQPNFYMHFNVLFRLFLVQVCTYMAMQWADKIRTAAGKIKGDRQSHTTNTYNTAPQSSTYFHCKQEN